MSSPVTVTITGAAGQIGYSLAFRLAHGDVFGAETPVRLQLMEIPGLMTAAAGVAMELDDCAFPLLESVDVYDRESRAFAGAQAAILVGARPRMKGMERSDLLEANAGIFGPQGKALNEHADDNVRVVVVGNPANTNAAILAAHAPDIAPNRITALTRLDHNRALSVVAKYAGVSTNDVTDLTIWGNHSAKQYPDLFNVKIAGRPAPQLVQDTEWLSQRFIPSVANRGTEILETRGSSSAASAASATLDHMRDWVGDMSRHDWTSVALPSDGSYGVPEGLVSSFPVRSVAGEWEIVQGLNVSDFSRRYIDASVEELISEREFVRRLGYLPSLVR